MNDKLLGSKTLVTEHRTYLVDAIGKKGVGRGSVSTRTQFVEEKDVEVTRLRPYIISRSSKRFLQIKTTFPVIAHFIPVPENDLEPEQPDGSYTTAVIYADNEVFVNSDLTIAVFDPDLVADKVRATAFNASTGETEFVDLLKIGDGMYRGTIPVKLLRMRGEDFDCVMNARNGDKLAIIYQDGRDATGEPRNIIKEIQVKSNFVTPVLMARRVVKADGYLGVCVHNTQELTPYVTVTNMRTNEFTSLSLNAVDTRYQGAVRLNGYMQLLEGDQLTVAFRYSDDYGELSILEQIVTVSYGDVNGIVTLPDTIKPNTQVVIGIDDPDVVTEYVDLVLSGDQTNAFSRLRATRLGDYLGVYQTNYVLEDKFKNDTSLTLTYTDTSSGVPKLVRKKMTVDRTVVVVPETPVDPTVPTEPSIVIEQMALQMEINGLFTLNGGFNGIIKLYAKLDETVRCSITQAS